MNDCTFRKQGGGWIFQVHGLITKSMWYGVRGVKKVSEGRNIRNP